MGTVTKSTKPGGGTDINSGQTAVVADVNTDMNTLFTLVNGNIDNDNVKAGAAIVASKVDFSSQTFTNTHIDASAAIDPEKLDDHSTDADEMAETRDPGETGSVTLSTSLVHELQTLRYAIRRLATGVAADITDGTNQTRWHDGPLRPGNHIANCWPGVSFGHDTSGVPDFWAKTGAPSTLETVALPVTEGEGNGVRCVDGTAGTGFQQTLDGLKASTQYLVVARVKPDVQVVSLQTTGADAASDYDDLDTDSANGSGSFETLSGIIQTDSTPTDIVVRLVGSDATSDWDTAWVGVWEIGDDPVPFPAYVSAYDTSTTTQNNMTSTVAISGLSAAVTVPGPGYVIRVSAIINLTSDSNGDARVRIRQNGTGVGTNTWFTTDTAENYSLAPVYTNRSPTPGTTYTYTVEFEGIQSDANVGGSGDQHEILVELIRTGGGA